MAVLSASVEVFSAPDRSVTLPEADFSCLPAVFALDAACWIRVPELSSRVCALPVNELKVLSDEAVCVSPAAKSLMFELNCCSWFFASGLSS